MAAASHFHSPSHSPRYLLALLILLLPTVLVSLLAFLVDILLFVPHLQWGGWIVLAATIILVACGVVTCAMRRTLVSRKARKKRIAENAEMSGANFYARQNAEAATFAKADSPPPMSSDTNAPLLNTLTQQSQPTSNSAPTFASYESARATNEEELQTMSSRTPSNRTPGPMDDGVNQASLASRPTRPGYNGPRDEYGNPIPPGPPASYGDAPGGMQSSSDPRLHNQYSDGSLGSRRGPGAQGYPPPGHSRNYPPRGGAYGYNGPYGGRGRGPPPNGRGSMRGMRGGGPPRNMIPGRGPPPGYPPRRDGDYDAHGSIPRRPSDRAGYQNYSVPYASNHARNPSASQPNLPEVDEAGHSFEMMPQSSEPNLRVRNQNIEAHRESNNQSLPSPSSVYSTE